MKFFFLLFFLLSTTLACSPKSTSQKPGEEPNNLITSQSAGSQAGLTLEEVPEEEPDPATLKYSPLEAIKALDQKVEAYKTNPDLSPEEQESNKKLKRSIIRGTFDIYELCRLALASHWSEITEAQKKYFSSLMLNLLEKKAIFSKEQVKGSTKPYRIEYKGQKFKEGDKTRATVISKLYVPSEKIESDLKYELLSTPKGWKIYDVIVDDASLVDVYKFQFDTIIKKGGFTDLLSRMEKKLKEME